jgi:hypothetical protein
MAYDWLRRSAVGTIFLDKSYDGLGPDFNFYALAYSLYRRVTEGSTVVCWWLSVCVKGNKR